jgi:tetratricopeptide (TPR) repeat protein
MKRLCLGLGLLLALTSLATPAADARIGKFVKYDTGEFVIITSRSASQAREIMQKLVKFRITLEKALGKRAARSGIGTHIIITSASDWKKYLQPREQVAGYFQRSMFDNYMALDGDAGEYAVYVMFHEYTHFYLSSQFSGDYPPWFNEGLAEVMAYVKFGKDNKVVLMIPMFQVQEARDSNWIPFDKLIKIDYRSPEYQSHQLAKEFYAQAWLTVHYGMLEDRAFGKQFMDYLTAMNKLVPQEEAARAAFGPDLSVPDAKLRAYSRKTNMSSGGLDLGDVPEFTLPPAQPMSEADGYAALIDLMLASPRDPARIRPLIEALQKREPDAARTWILTARVAEKEDDSPGFDAAVDKAGKLLAADDIVGRRELATVLLMSASNFDPMNNRTTEDTNRDLKRALKWFVAAVEKDPGDARALWGLGTVLTRLDSQLDLAETALVAAYQQVPASSAISTSLASLMARQDKLEEMIRYLQDTIRIASDLGLRRWATETLGNVQESLVQQKKVDEENRKQREQYEKDLAEYEKKYGKQKKKKPAQ